MATRVSTIIERKGSEVVTTTPSATLADAAGLLAEHRIGALVVSTDGTAIEGMLSERDIVCRLAEAGAEALGMSVEQAMSTDVTTCTWETTTDELMAVMTERRVRHVPVVEGGAMVAIVSIGDVVKSRMDELTLEADQLQAYVTGGY